MSVTSVTELRSARTSGRSQSESNPPQYGYSARRTFLVLVSSVDDPPILAETADGIPRLGEAYPGYEFLRVSKVDAAVDSTSELVYIVNVDYSNSVSGNESGDTENPLLQPPEISWDFEESNEPVYQDGDGIPILNSAGQTFDPPIELEVADPVLTITRNESSFNAAMAVLYANVVNSDSFWGPPGQAKMKPITASRGFKNNIYYWRVTYRIVFRPNYPNGNSGWTRNILDEGRYELKNTANGPQLIPIMNAGAPASDPVLLDGSGSVLAVGSDPIFRFVRPRRLPFSVWGLPNS